MQQDMAGSYQGIPMLIRTKVEQDRYHFYVRRSPTKIALKIGGELSLSSLQWVFFCLRFLPISCTYQMFDLNQSKAGAKRPRCHGCFGLSVSQPKQALRYRAVPL